MDLQKGIAKLLWHAARSRLYSYQPYPKQYEFHAMGKTHKQRLFMAGNQTGKTWSGGYEFALHATGDYDRLPWPWPGRRYDRPLRMWACSISNERQRQVTQKILLGTEIASMKAADFGTGAIPKAAIKDISVRQAGVKNVVDQAIIQWRGSNRETIISFKVYEQGRIAFQGETIDVIWADEEPPGVEGPFVFTEMETRQQTIEDAILYMTFTPLLGRTEIVEGFMSPDPDMAAIKTTIGMTIFDAVGGVWPDGTPWAGQEWSGHYTQEQAEREMALKKPHERSTRIFGIPMMGEGAVFPVDEDALKFDAMDFPRGFPAYWPRIIGIDFGIGHPCGIVWCAWDRDNDIMWVYDCYRKAGETPAQHAVAIRTRPGWEWMPVAWPHDGHNKDKGTGKALVREYRDCGVHMMAESARFDDEVGGGQSTEQSNARLLERMETGRLKIARHLHDLFEEIRLYHRKNGRVVDVKEDLIRALGYAEMELRHAKTPMPRSRPKPRYTRPIVGARL